MYTWSVDPENSPCSSPAMLTYPALKTHTLNLLSAFQTLDLFPQTLEKTELATCYSAGWLIQGERKGSSGVELFLWKLSFQKHFCIENEGFLWSISAVLYFHGLTQAKRQPLRSHFQIWFNSQRQYPNLHPGMKSKQSVAQNTSFKKAWSAASNSMPPQL